MNLNDFSLRILKYNENHLIDEVSKGVYTFKDGYSRDYFPNYFIRWTMSSNRYIQGLFLKNELVALRCDTILDNGKTLFGEALRVAEKHRNKRYAAILNQLSADKRQDIIFPRYNIIRSRFAKASHVLDTSIVINNTLKPRPWIKVLNKSTAITFAEPNLIDYINKNISSININNNNINIDIISPLEAFKMTQEQKNLFPFQSFYTDWVVYECSYDNFLILGSGGQGNFERKYLRLKAFDDHESFAVFGITPRGSGIALNLDIHTNNEEDILLFCLYICNNMNELRTSYSWYEPDTIWLWIPYHLNQTKIYQSIDSLFKNHPKYFSIHCIYFENDKPNPKQSKL